MRFIRCFMILYCAALRRIVAIDRFLSQPIPSDPILFVSLQEKDTAESLNNNVRMLRNSLGVSNDQLSLLHNNAEQEQEQEHSQEEGRILKPKKDEKKGEERKEREEIEENEERFKES